METTGVKYIGSKSSLIPSILKAIDESSSIPITSVLDVFTGTTRVAQACKKRGWTVTTSDLSWASDAYSHTWIANEGSNTHLQIKLNHLNGLEGEAGWITNNYCDVKGEQDGIVRVWQPKNGARADVIRDTINLWQTNGEISEWEAKTLTTSLILALDKVDNTVGVQQAYLKSWCTRSKNDLVLELPKTLAGPKGNHLIGDCLKLNYPQADVAYIDPPYSTHSYATYYHIWDSIAKWDKPAVGLKTNRRMDRISGSTSFDESMSSAWNSKKTAFKAFGDLIDRLPARNLIVSYNNESLVPIDKLLELFKKYPSVKTTKIDYARNIMCQIGNAAKDKTDVTEFATKNVEYLFTIQKA
jgi:adenine-specific DNA-methyltransferase